MNWRNSPTFGHPLVRESDTTTRMLKYRFKHLAKADLEASWKGISVGASFRYASFMKNIDAIFEGKVFGTEILPGLKTYRQKFNKGVPVFDFRMGYEFLKNYRVSLIMNNVFNAEYSTRPGDIQAPRTYLVQLQMKF